MADIVADDGPASVVAAARDAFGRIDVLHNNVGIGAGDGPPHHLTDEAFDRILDVNLRALWRTCREAVPVLRDGGGRHRQRLVAGAIASAGNLTAYKISKAGVNALTQNLALTNAKHGVRANAVMPGFIDTPMAVDAPAAALGLDRADYARLPGRPRPPRPSGHGLGRGPRRPLPGLRRGPVHHRRGPRRRRRPEHPGGLRTVRPRRGR